MKTKLTLLREKLYAGNQAFTGSFVNLSGIRGGLNPQETEPPCGNDTCNNNFCNEGYNFSCGNNQCNATATGTDNAGCNNTSCFT